MKMKMLFEIPYVRYNLPFLDDVRKTLIKENVEWTQKEVAVDDQETHVYFYVREEDCNKVKRLVQEQYSNHFGNECI